MNNTRRGFFAKMGAIVAAPFAGITFSGGGTARRAVIAAPPMAAKSAAAAQTLLPVNFIGRVRCDLMMIGVDATKLTDREVLQWASYLAVEKPRRSVG